MTKVHYPTDDWQSPCDGTDLPYDWVPIALNGTDQSRDLPQAPIWHDGANDRQTELYSGELRCTLRTLSPLLVGNQQVTLRDVLPAIGKQIEGSCSPVRWPNDVNKARDEEYAFQKKKNGNDTEKLQRIENELNRRIKALEKKHEEKKILFPLTLGSDGPVLLSGESLKGMFRHALGALLSSPMERVAEETYSYRPNTVLPNRKTNTRPFAAKVEDFDSQSCRLKLRVVEDLRAIEFVHGDELVVPSVPGKPCQIPGGTCISNKVRNANGRWVNSPSGSCASQDYFWLNYHFGLNGVSGFAKVAGKSYQPHPSVLVPVSKVGATTTVDPAVVRQYLDTIEHLENGETGHFSRNKPDFNWSPPRPSLQKGDLIFCESLGNSKTGQNQIISFGHNFRYRWKHLNTVTTLAIEFDDAKKEWNFRRRVELLAHPDEKPAAVAATSGTPAPPGALTAVRNLLGYVIDKDNAAFGRGDADRLKALQDPFDRLAGRISFNIAMERLKESEQGSHRFVNADRGCFLFLHPTVSPKASFSRSYVPGQNGTWGDGLLKGKVQVGDLKQERYWVQNGTRTFAGRKFYPHQFERNPESKVTVPKQNYDLGALVRAFDSLPNHGKPTAHSRFDLVEYLWSNQSSIACRVSKPGREFGFTVRFKDLRAAELAALVAVLMPGRLAAVILKCESSTLKQTREHLCTLAQAKKLAFAHKLGHGRALGMGSVQIRADACLRWPQTLGGQEQTLKDDDFDALIRTHLLERLDDKTTLAWFKALQIEPDRIARPYLLHRSGNNPQAIVRWAQEERKKHLEQSRQDGPPPNFSDRGQ